MENIGDSYRDRKDCALKLITVTAFLTSACSALFPQTIDQQKMTSKTPVTLSCVRAAAGGSNKVTFQTDYGSQAREIMRTLTYTCAVRWTGRSPTNAVLDVWFVGIPASGGKDMILDNQNFPISLMPMSNTVVNVTSAPH